MNPGTLTLYGPGVADIFGMRRVGDLTSRHTRHCSVRFNRASHYRTGADACAAAYRDIIHHHHAGSDIDTIANDGGSLHIRANRGHLPHIHIIADYGVSVDHCAETMLKIEAIADLHPLRNQKPIAALIAMEHHLSQRIEPTTML